MPDSVKISELNSRTAVGTDVVPAVDSTFSQTVRVSAASIAAIGGGPPGDNTVSTGKIQNQSVTYAKIQNVSATDRILGRQTANAGTVEEIVCTPFARTLLAAATSQAAVTAIGALASTVTPVFTGVIRGVIGSATNPAYSATSATDAGMFFPDGTAVGFASDGYERFRVGEDGTLYCNFPGTSISGELRPMFVCRAWLNFDGSTGTPLTLTTNSQVAARYGRSSPSSIRNDTATTSYLGTLEPAGTTTVFGSTSSDGRNNYSTPADNKHWAWVSNAWTKVAANTGNWIGNASYTRAGVVGPRDSGNVSSITDNGVGDYTINFTQSMPNADYCVVGTTNALSGTTGNACVVRVHTLTTTSARITVVRVNTTTSDETRDVTTICLAFFG